MYCSLSFLISWLFYKRSSCECFDYLSHLHSVLHVSEFLSSMLELKVLPVKFVTGVVLSDMEAWKQSDVLLLDNLFRFKEESANCKAFAKQLSSGIDIFVNDDFSQSHKILASTVGIASFCNACIAGFYFEEGLRQLEKISTTSKKPYFAIVSIYNTLSLSSIFS